MVGSFFSLNKDSLPTRAFGAITFAFINPLLKETL